MNSKQKLGWIVAAVFVAMIGTALNAHATGAKGMVKGKVVKADGTAVAGAEVRLMAKVARPAKPADATAPAPKTKAEKRASRQAEGATREAIARGTTDANGEFVLNDVPEGSYVVAARLKGFGNARRPVGVRAGDPAHVSLTLKEQAAAAKPRKQAAHKAKPAA
jgi:hypothetical protein